MAAAVAELHRLTHRARAYQRKAVPQGRTPHGGPVHHEREPGLTRRRQDGIGAGKVCGHGLLDHDRQAPSQRPNAQLRGCAVVGEDQDGVEIGPLQERVVAGQRLHAAMLARETFAQPRIRVRRGHRLPQLVVVERGKIAPHMIVIEPENADSQPSHDASLALSVRFAA